MTIERFTAEGLNIQDNSAKGMLYLLEEQGGVNALCNLINGLNNKTNRLEKENEELKIELNALRKKYNGFSDMVDKRLQEINKGWLE